MAMGFHFGCTMECEAIRSHFSLLVLLRRRCDHKESLRTIREYQAALELACGHLPATGAGFAAARACCFWMSTNFAVYSP